MLNLNRLQTRWFAKSEYQGLCKSHKKCPKQNIVTCYSVKHQQIISKQTNLPDFPRQQKTSNQMEIFLIETFLFLLVYIFWSSQAFHCFWNELEYFIAHTMTRPRQEVGRNTVQTLPCYGFNNFQLQFNWLHGFLEPLLLPSSAL